MVKFIYIILFTVLGFFIGFLIYASVEIPANLVLFQDINSQGFAVGWREWTKFSDLLKKILLVVGALFGHWQGHYWWRQIYIRRKGKKKR